MADTFSATSLQQTKSNIDGRVNDIVGLTNQLSHITSNLASIVAAGSGTLAGSWGNISQTYSEVGDSINISKDELLREFTNYINDTLKNESASDSSLKQSNDSLEELNTEISSI